MSPLSTIATPANQQPFDIKYCGAELSSLRGMLIKTALMKWCLLKEVLSILSS